MKRTVTEVVRELFPGDTETHERIYHRLRNVPEYYTIEEALDPLGRDPARREGCKKLAGIYHELIWDVPPKGGA